MNRFKRRFILTRLCEGADEFDMASALGEMSKGLGFEEPTPAGDEGDDLGLGDAVPEGSKVEPNPKEAAPAAPEAKEDEASTPEGETTPPNTPAPEERKAPTTWRPEAAGEWDKLPPVVQDEILKREKDIFNGLEQYKGEATLGKEFRQIMQPYMPILQQYNVDPRQQVSDLMNAHYTLLFGQPEQKVALMKQIITDYKIDPKSVFDGTAPAGNEDYIDPAVKDLQKEIGTIKSSVQSILTSAQQETYKAFEQQALSFVADPANKYAEEVVNEMTVLIKTKQAANLKEAYDKAIWMNPVVRQKVLQEQQAEAAAKAKAEREARVKAAEKATAAQKVVSRQGSRSDTTPAGSWEDTMAETLANIKSRTS